MEHVEHFLTARTHARNPHHFVMIVVAYLHTIIVVKAKKVGAEAPGEKPIVDPICLAKCKHSTKMAVVLTYEDCGMRA